jgi:hypothetical protein
MKKQARWYMPIILAFGRLRRENLKFKVSLDYKMGLSQKNKNEKSNEVISHTETTSGYYYLLIG